MKYCFILALVIVVLLLIKLLFYQLISGHLLRLQYLQVLVYFTGVSSSDLTDHIVCSKLITDNDRKDFVAYHIMNIPDELSRRSGLLKTILRTSDFDVVVLVDTVYQNQNRILHRKGNTSIISYENDFFLNDFELTNKEYDGWEIDREGEFELLYFTLHWWPNDYVCIRYNSRLDKFQFDYFQDELYRYECNIYAGNPSYKVRSDKETYYDVVQDQISKNTLTQTFADIFILLLLFVVVTIIQIYLSSKFKNN